MHALHDQENDRSKGDELTDSRILWQQKKAEEARKRKAENDLRKLEDEISDLEERIRLIDEQFALPENATDSVKLTNLSKDRENLSVILDQKYALWEELV